MSSDTPSKTPWGLIVSIAVNGLLIGLLAGVMLAGGPKQRGGPSGPAVAGGGDRGLARAIVRAAPEADRAEVRKLMGDAWKSAAADRMAIREAQRAIAEAIAASDFDGTRVMAEFEKWREADMRVKAGVQEAMVQVLEKLPPESRAALSKQMARHDARRERREKRRRNRRGD